MLDLSPEDEGNGRAIFLDEFRMMIFTRGRAVDSFGLILINTLASQDHQRNFRLFCLPARYRDWATSMDIDYGTPDQDRPFIVDPTQAFIVLQFFGGEKLSRVWVILRTQALIEHASSVGTETYIPWEEWGRDAIVMEMPMFTLTVYVQGVHMVEVGTQSFSDGEVEMDYMCLRTFDFSKWGYSTLCDEGGEAVRETWYEDGRELLLEESEDMDGPEFGSLGNGILYSLVSCLCHWKMSVG